MTKVLHQLLVLLLAGVCSGFVNRPAPAVHLTPLYGEVIQVKFRIHADGRVEESVHGVKGTDCQKVTEDLNEKLGTVLNTEPTEEMFEEKTEDSLYDSQYSEW